MLLENAFISITEDPCASKTNGTLSKYKGNALISLLDWWTYRTSGAKFLYPLYILKNPCPCEQPKICFYNTFFANTLYSFSPPFHYSRVVEPYGLYISTLEIMHIRTFLSDSPYIYSSTIVYTIPVIICKMKGFWRINAMVPMHVPHASLIFYNIREFERLKSSKFMDIIPCYFSNIRTFITIKPKSSDVIGYLLNLDRLRSMKP